MDRRNFVGNAIAGSMLAGTAAQAQQQKERVSEAGGGGSTDWHVDEIFIERKRPGKPHKGKTLAAIQPHCDDIPIYAGGTVLKLDTKAFSSTHRTMRWRAAARRSARSSTTTSVTPAK